MNVDLITTLEKCGLKEREAKVYLATLELNESTVLPIAQKAGIKRTYCYDILEDLGKWGLVSYYEKNGRRRYIAEDPRKIKELLKSRLEGLEGALPELRSIFNRPAEKPRVRYFEGKQGIISLYQEILKERPKTLDAISSPALIEAYIGEPFIDYLKKISQTKIKSRDLIAAKNESAKLAQILGDKGQELRILPPEFRTKTDLIIYNDKVVMISYGADIHAVVIESPGIVETHRSLFELAWKAANRIGELQSS